MNTRPRTITEIVAATARDGRRQGWVEGGLVVALLFMLALGLR